MKRGISSCNNCHRVFESSPFHRVLSASWLVRRSPSTASQDVLVSQHGLTPDEADFVLEFVVDDCMSHDEFVEVARKVRLSEDCETCLDVA